MTGCNTATEIRPGSIIPEGMGCQTAIEASEFESAIEANRSELCHLEDVVNMLLGRLVPVLKNPMPCDPVEEKDYRFDTEVAQHVESASKRIRDTKLRVADAIDRLGI